MTDTRPTAVQPTEGTSTVQTSTRTRVAQIIRTFRTIRPADAALAGAVAGVVLGASAAVGVDSYQSPAVAQAAPAAEVSVVPHTYPRTTEQGLLDGWLRHLIDQAVPAGMEQTGDGAGASTYVHGWPGQRPLTAVTVTTVDGKVRRLPVPATVGAPVSVEAYTPNGVTRTLGNTAGIVVAGASGQTARMELPPRAVAHYGNDQPNLLDGPAVTAITPVYAR